MKKVLVVGLIDIILCSLLLLAPLYLLISFVVIAIIFLLSIKYVDYSYVILIVLVVLTNYNLSLYNPKDYLFNTLYPFHIFASVFFICYILRKIALRENLFNGYDFLDLVLFCWILLCSVAIFWSPDCSFSVFRFSSLVMCFFAYLLMVNLVHDFDTTQTAINTWIIVGTLMSFAILASLLLKKEFLYIVSAYPDIPHYAFIHIGNVNPSRGSGFAEPKYASNFVVTAISLALAQLVTTPSYKQRVKYLLVSLMMFFCLLFTQCRGALAGLLIAVAFLLIALYPYRSNLIRSITAVACALIITFCFFLVSSDFVRSYHGVKLGSSSSSRYSAVESGGQSLEFRIDLWGDYLRTLAKKHAYLYGLGTGGSAYDVIPLPHAHGIYASIFFDLGFLGVALFLLLLAPVAVWFIEVFRAEKGPYKNLLGGFCAGLIALSANAVIEFDYFMPLIWVYLGLGRAIMQQLKETAHSR